jgi:hypothetical protein
VREKRAVEGFGQSTAEIGERQFATGEKRSQVVFVNSEALLSRFTAPF